MKKFSIAILLIFTTTTSALAADWGTLKGRLVFDGDAGKPDPINVNKDVEFCSQHKPVDERLVVGEEGGLANACVYLYLKKGKSVPVHPDLEKPSEKPVVLDNKGCRFDPHVLTVRTGQTLEVRNSDSVAHNTNASALISNAGFNETIPKDTPLVKSFENRESYPSEVSCSIHPWMKAYILIRDNPYMAVTDKEGNFEIKNLPTGKHEFIFWHEGKGNLRSINVGSTKTDRKGRAKLEIKADETLDLGEVKVSAKALGR